MHKLDDDTLVTPDLLRKFIAFAQDETRDERHYALIQRSDRSWLAHNPGAPELDGVQTVYTQALLTLLNDELHHDGAWVALWSGPGQREVFTQVPGAYCCLNLIWLDKDGDAQFRVDWMAGESESWMTLPDLLLAGVHAFADQCETAWQTTNQMVQASLDRRLNHNGAGTHRKALGEAAPSLQ